MSFTHSPKIPTDQLTLCLDATNTKSHRTSATVWTDLAQGLPFNVVGTATPKTTYGNAQGFTGNSSGYWECSTNTSTVDLGGNCTLIMWIYCVTPGTRRTIFEKAGTLYNSYEQEIACTWELDNAISWYSRYNEYDYSSTAAMIANRWNMVGIKMSTGKSISSRTGFYSMDGGAWVSNYFSRTSTALVPAGNIRVMSGYAGTVDTGAIGMVMVYNKMLNNIEISQVFNATRSRFGV
jgi:hypothetical protein